MPLPVTKLGGIDLNENKAKKVHKNGDLLVVTFYGYDDRDVFGVEITTRDGRHRRVTFDSLWTIEKVYGVTEWEVASETD